MRNVDEIFAIYLDEISSFKRISTLKNSSFCLTEQNIEDSIISTADKWKDIYSDIILSDKEKIELIKKIKSIYEVFQEEGVALLGDYDHDYTWHENLLNQEDFEEYFWQRYKNHLSDDKRFPPQVINILENNTLKNLMSYIGNPNDIDNKFSIRGLVVGDVQSGKTSNYLGLITKAADAGYKVIFLLTGTIESLRQQTQIRVEEGFIGYDSVNGIDVGVGRGEKTPKVFTSREKDFTGKDNQNTTYKISDYSSEPMIFVLKKNTSVLKKLYTSLKKINTATEHDKINYPMLIVDDEADNASINTNKPEDDPTKINALIRNILNLFTRTTYVGFTATPFANVFISYDDENEMLKDDLFPRDFIYALKAPSNYQGAKKYFFEDDNVHVHYIDDFDEQIFPMNHKKEWAGERLFGSIYHAINTFILVNAVRDLRDVKKNTHRSMLINMSRYTKVQGVIKSIVLDYFERVKIDLKQTSKYDVDYALTNKSVAALKASYDKEFYNVVYNGSKLKFEEVFPFLYESIKNVIIQVVNSSKTSEKLNYDDKKGTRVIAIGGLALSRGLTLEGLCVSYFFRNSATFDVLMQMGRWFGYREGYDDLCRIFLTETSARYYKEICQSIDCLKEDIEKMGKQNKKPKDYGIRVRNNSRELGITALNKRRNTKSKVERKSYYGNVFETPYLHKNLEIIENNIKSTKAFLDSIDKNKRDKDVCKYPYFKDIPKKDIIDLLNNLQIHGANENFDIKQLNTFLKRADNELKLFDVLIIGGDSKRIFTNDLHGISMKLVKRRFDIKEEIVRMNAKSAHLIGSADTKYGLKEEEIKIIRDGSKAQDYLIKGRHPLFVIYFIDPNNNGHYNEEENTYRQELLAKEDQYLVGYAIGFPKKDDEITDVATYIVNKTVNYYEKEHDYEGDDANE